MKKRLDRALGLFYLLFAVLLIANRGHQHLAGTTPAADTFAFWVPLAFTALVVYVGLRRLRSALRASSE